MGRIKTTLKSVYGKQSKAFWDAMLMQCSYTPFWTRILVLAASRLDPLLSYALKKVFCVHRPSAH